MNSLGSVCCLKDLQTSLHRVCGNVNTCSTVQMSRPNTTWFDVIRKVSSSDNLSSSPSPRFPSTSILLSGSSNTPPSVTPCRDRQSFEHDTQLLLTFFFTTVLSQWDFSRGKFGLPSPGKASCNRVALPNLGCMLGCF